MGFHTIYANMHNGVISKSIPAAGENWDVYMLLQVLKAIGNEKTIEEVLRVVTKMVDSSAEKQYKVCPVFHSTLVGKLIFRLRQKDLQVNIAVYTAMITWISSSNPTS